MNRIGVTVAMAAAATFLGACSTQVDTARPALFRAAPSGIDYRYGSPAGPYRSFAHRWEHRRAQIERDFFVSDGGNEVVSFANDGYRLLGSITHGLSHADGMWIDKQGNLYVANYSEKQSPVSVVEYRPGASSPACTYSRGLNDPIGVTSDAAGNVYVIDFNFLSDPGYIDEYAQCRNKIVAQYPVESGPVGAAIDDKGDLFVSFFTAQNTGGFEEFVAGSKSATVLGVSVASPGGLILDKSGNLIADDQAGSIDIIAPPYTSAKVLADGLKDPFHCALDSKERLLFNANAGYASVPPTVTVYEYPSGKLVTTLGPSDGIEDAQGIAESPNAVF